MRKYGFWGKISKTNKERRKKEGNMNLFWKGRSKLTKAVFFIVAIIFLPISLGIYLILKVRKKNWDETVKSLAILFLAVIFFFLSTAWVSAMFSSNNSNSSKTKGVKEENIPEKKKSPTPIPTPTPSPSPSPSLSPVKPSPSPLKPSPSPKYVEDKKENPLDGYICDCSKTCPEISACEEAYYQLNNCGCNIRDGDNDGVPCEDICPGGKSTSQTVPIVPEPSIPNEPVNEGSGFTCNCSKTCPQMSSCAEAQYQLNVCNCKVRDGDSDGIACDNDCQ